MKQPTPPWLSELPTAFRNYCAGRELEEVECIVPDLAGMSRGKAMPLSKFSPTQEMYLPISIFYQTITGQDVAMDITNQWAESDVVLKPDMATARAAPWAPDARLQIIHDMFDQRGKPIRVAPRNVLRHIRKLYARQGWRPVVAPELEFYLVQPNLDPNEPIRPPVSRTGRQGTANQSYSMSAVDDYGPVIDTMYDYARDAGLTIDTLIQEDGAGQVEINLFHGDPVALADQVFYFKRLIREAALKHGVFATFMAKPMRDQPGSAMHVHHSVVDIDSGKNIFSDKKGRSSKHFMHFIGGCQHYLPQAMPLLSPYVNSYRRFELASNSSAPTNFSWGYDNRATGLRVPNAGPADRRLENRVVGVDSNPYLSIAAGLACGYLGMMNKLKPGTPAAGETDDDRYSIPTTLEQALTLFDQASDLHGVLGKDFCRVYAAVKREEARLYRREISPWEREHLLLNV